MVCVIGLLVLVITVFITRKRKRDDIDEIDSCYGRSPNVDEKNIKTLKMVGRDKMLGRDKIISFTNSANKFLFPELRRSSSSCCDA